MKSKAAFPLYFDSTQLTKQPTANRGRSGRISAGDVAYERVHPIIADLTYLANV